MVIVVGLPGHGKTTIVRGETLGHLNNHASGIALVHDVNRQFRDMCACFDDAAAWRAAAAAAGLRLVGGRLVSDKPFHRGASVGGSAADLIQLALELGRAHNTAGNPQLPIELAFDETSLMDTSGSTHVHVLDNIVMSNRRHLGIKPIYNVQRPTQLTEGFYSQATAVYILAQNSARRTRVLEEYLGLPDGALLPLVGAGKYRYLLWRSGEGLVTPDRARLSAPQRQLGGS
jgi:hypothetical protein